MKFEDLLSQILFWSIAGLSAFIAWEFFTSKNGRLRILMIRLFSCKVWVYGGAALWFLFFDKHIKIPFVYVRIILTLPMAIVMFQIYKFIRIKK